MSPVVYKSYVSQIKMKTLKPEIEELTKKFKNVGRKYRKRKNG